jgi:hypothetical protein
MSADLTALKALAADQDLIDLEKLINRFNVFEAMGLARQELSHSNLLAYFLDPSQPHGMRGVFLRHFFTRASAQIDVADSRTELTTDVKSIDIDRASVFREWRNIDILVLLEKERLAVIIENKIDSSEHSNQLCRYYESVKNEFSDWGILPYYLTPDGTLASNDRYVGIGYGILIDAVQDVLTDAETKLQQDVRMSLEHYVQLLRRHVVAESDVAKECRRLYQKHRRALDLILEHRPDRLDEIRRVLDTLVKESTPAVRWNWSSKTWIQFSTPALDQGQLHVPEAVHKSRRLLLFWFGNQPEGLDLTLYIQPGPVELRQRFYVLANSHPSLHTTGTLKKSYHPIYRRQFVTRNLLDTATLEEIEQTVKAEWQKFLTLDLPGIDAAVHHAITHGLDSAP